MGPHLRSPCRPGTCPSTASWTSCPAWLRIAKNIRQGQLVSDQETVEKASHSHTELLKHPHRTSSSFAFHRTRLTSLLDLVLPRGLPLPPLIAQQPAPPHNTHPSALPPSSSQTSTAVFLRAFCPSPRELVSRVPARDAIGLCQSVHLLVGQFFARLGPADHLLFLLLLGRRRGRADVAQARERLRDGGQKSTSSRFGLVTHYLERHPSCVPRTREET